MPVSAAASPAGRQLRAARLLRQPRRWQPSLHRPAGDRGGFNGIAIQIRLAEKFFWDYAGEVPLILKLNGKTDMPSDAEALSPLHASVENAVRLGADAVGYTLYVGTPAAERDFAQLRAVRRAAERSGMPLVVWAYPRGAAVEAKGGKDSFYAVDYAARTASELGADVVKVNFPNPSRRSGVKPQYDAEFTGEQAIDAVVRSANRTLLLVSGEEKAGDEAMLEKGPPVDGGRRHRPDLRPERVAAPARRLAAVRRPAGRGPRQVPVPLTVRLPPQPDGEGPTGAAEQPR